MTGDGQTEQRAYVGQDLLSMRAQIEHNGGGLEAWNFRHGHVIWFGKRRKGERAASGLSQGRIHTSLGELACVQACHDQIGDGDAPTRVSEVIRPFRTRCVSIPLAPAHDTGLVLLLKSTSSICYTYIKKKNHQSFFSLHLHQDKPGSRRSAPLASASSVHSASSSPPQRLAVARAGTSSSQSLPPPQPSAVPRACRWSLPLSIHLLHHGCNPTASTIVK